MKYAKSSGLVAWSGGEMLLTADKTSIDDDHPLVAERPELWKDDHEPSIPGPARLAGEPPRRVERATNAPGERRGDRR